MFAKNIQCTSAVWPIDPPASHDTSQARLAENLFTFGGRMWSYGSNECQQEEYRNEGGWIHVLGRFGP